MESSIAIKFPLVRGSEQSGNTFPWFSPICQGIEYDGPDGTRAKRKLRSMIEEEISCALKAQEDKQRQTYVIGCTDHTVLIVGWRYGSWGYDIYGPGRKYASSCSMPGTFEQARDAAISHASSSYGGIVYEMQGSR